MKKDISCSVHMSSWDLYTEDFVLPAEETFKLFIDYPCDKTEFQIKTGKKGLGLAGLVTAIVKNYSKIYEDPDKYNVWGHDMGDLYLSGISINFDKKIITIDVDS